jgi:hypothetical protein
VVSTDEPQGPVELGMESPHRLRRLAAWYRDFAERAGNPVIWKARLMTAKRLDQEPDRLEVTLVSAPNRAAQSGIDGTEPTGGSVDDEFSANADRPAPQHLGR